MEMEMTNDHESPAGMTRDAQLLVLKKAIAFGYQRGCQDSEAGTQSDADDEAEDALAEFLASCTNGT